MFLFVEKKKQLVHTTGSAQQMTDTSDEHLAGKETDGNTESEQILRTPIKVSSPFRIQAVEITQKPKNLEKKIFYFCK